MSSHYAKELEEDLKWREGEIAVIKKQVFESSAGSLRYTALLRAMWAMLYAHYEGFCKFGFDLFLDAVAKTKSKRSIVRDELVAFSLKPAFKVLSGNLTNDACRLFLHDLPSLLDQSIEFDAKLETNSNLYPKILAQNCDILSLPHQNVDDNETRLNALVSRRNEIAHGKKMIIKNLKEYQEYEDAALLVMHELAVSIIDALERNGYLKAP